MDAPQGSESARTQAPKDVPSWDADTHVRVPVLTLLAHPDRRRLGERALLTDLASGRPQGLARGTPAFSQPGQRTESSLGSSCLSRSPIRLKLDSETGSIEIDARESPTRLDVAGTVRDFARLDCDALDRGIVLCLAQQIVLLLHSADPLVDHSLPDYGLVGESEAMARVRADIERLAPLDVSVLLRGETGTGKELVARALHSAGPRSQGPFVALNMASIPPALAASELFGASKGAYTGATRDRAGVFQRAHGGTLFLDEIGDTPEEIQALLLRVLETREVHPVGSQRAVPVDVRLISATDLDLELAIVQGRFRTPLLHRLAGFEVPLPPLRERLDDLGRLFFHFLDHKMETLSGERPNPGDLDLWPPAGVVAQLATRPWPGNVRQLANAARQLAILGPEATAPQRVAWLATAGVDPRESSSASAEKTPQVQPAPIASPGELSEDTLLATLRQVRFRIQDAAQQLGFSRAALYRRMAQSSRIRMASDLDTDTIARAIEETGGELSDMVDLLEVSAPALRRRMRQLGFD